MGKYPDPLPPLELCNNYKPFNPVQGKGPLGNQYSGKMYYTGKERKKFVETLQSMLIELNYDVGPTGVDGKFGDNTQKAVELFQNDYKDYDELDLKEDKLVGPRTSDALNRAMVGHWYDSYQTPKKLVKEIPYWTVTSDFLTSGLSIEVGKEEEAKVFIVDKVGVISEVKWEKPSVVTFDDSKDKYKQVKAIENDMKVKAIVKTKSLKNGEKASLEVYQFKKDGEPTLYKKIEGLHVLNDEVVGGDDQACEVNFEWHDTIYEYKRTQYFFKAKAGHVVKAVEQKKDTMIRLKEFDLIVSNPDDTLPGTTTRGLWLQSYLENKFDSEDGGCWMEATENKLGKPAGHEVIRFNGQEENVSKDKLSDLVKRNKFLYYQASHGHAYCHKHSPPIGVQPINPASLDWWCPICKDPNLNNVKGVIILKKQGLEKGYISNQLYEESDVLKLVRAPKVLVLATCCLTAITKTFPEAWLKKGTEWYIGFRRETYSPRSFDFTQDFIKHWCNGHQMDPSKVRDAFDEIVNNFDDIKPRCFHRGK